jgi:hypothetical protein
VTANYVTLTGTIPNAPGATATFVPTGWLTVAASDLLFAPVATPAILNGSGHFSVSLFATDNVVYPWHWVVTFTGIPGVAAYSFPFALAYANGATQDISSLAPGGDSEGGGGGSVFVIYESGGSYPLRDTATSSDSATVFWVGPDAPAIGSGYAVNGVDLWFPETV